MWYCFSYTFGVKVTNHGKTEADAKYAAELDGTTAKWENDPTLTNLEKWAIKAYNKRVKAREYQKAHNEAMRSVGMKKTPYGWE